VTHRLLVLCTVLAALPLPAAAQAQRTPGRPPAAPRVEIGIGAGIGGGLALGERDAALRSNSVTPSPFRLFSTDTRVEPSAVVEVRLGYRVTSRLTIEGTLGMARPNLTSSLSADVENAAAVDATSALTEYVVTGGALWRFSSNARRRLTPFVSGGGGVARHVHDRRTLIESGVDSYVGGGLLYALGRRTGLRLDGRMHFLSGGIAEGEDVRPRGALTGSIFVAF
jgi:hypothetical protein